MSRYVIISGGRSGTQLMVDLLESHPQIISSDEVLNPAVNAFDYPLKALEEVYAYPDRTCGFKLLYHHADVTEGPAIWEYLQKQKDLKIIHSVRDNSLARIISLKISQETGVWHHFSEREMSTKVKLKPQQCNDIWSHWDEREGYVDESFSDHPILKVHYSDLARDIPGTMDKVQKFLGVEPRELKSRIKKRCGHPFDRLENFEELRQHFKGTKWEWFFSDEDPYP